jgi:hypothetical protein
MMQFRKPAEVSMHSHIFTIALAVVLLATVPGRASTQARPPATTADPHAAHQASSHRAAEIAFLFPDGDDKGWSRIENGMKHNTTPDVPLALIPAETRALLLRQLALTSEVTRKFPTVKDAEAAGYRRAGPFLPGLGTHYVGGRTNRTGMLTDADILSPSTIIFDGASPDSPIAGFMYISVAAGPSAREPEGFAGPNDRWHYHVGICLTPGSNGVTEALGFDGSITESDCRARGGNYIAATQYMLHVWTVPGYSSALGVFSHMNPALTCADGTYHMDKTDITNACKVRK